MKAPFNQKFAIGKIIVDPNSSAIYLKGTEKRLEPKLIALLCLLAAQGRDVISRQAITDAIWPEVIVGEESITRAIFALRNALGDDAKQPLYIETIPKKGYRFLVDAQLIEDAELVPETNVSKSFLKSKTLRVSFIFVAIVFTLIFWMSYTDDKAALEVESLVPLDKKDGVERDLALRADGEKLLFIHSNESSNSLYSHDVKTGIDTPWTKDDFLKSSPIWIDKNSVAYIRKNKGDFQIARHYQGQSPQILYQSLNPILQLSMAQQDSEHLFFLEFQNNDLIELKSINLLNGNLQNWRDTLTDLPRKITQLKSANQPNILLLLKDEIEKPTIISVDLKSKSIEILNSQFSQVNKFSVLSEKNILIVGTLGASQGIWMLEEKKSPRLILRSSGAEEIVDAQMDVSKHLIFYANLLENKEVRSISLRDSGSDNLPELNSTGIEMKGMFSKVKNSIYFTSNRTGYSEVWRYDILSKEIKQISHFNASLIIWFSESHQGQFLAVAYRAEEMYLDIIDTNTGQLKQRTLIPVPRFPLAWSFDDKTIYVSEHQSEVNLYTYDAATLKPQLFAKKAGLYAKELDGTHLVYVDYTRHALVERDLQSQQEKILHDTIPNLFWINPGMLKLNQNNDGFYAICDIGGHNKLCSYSFSTTDTAPLVLKDLPYNFWISDIAEDGEKFLATEAKASTGNIMKMQLKH